MADARDFSQGGTRLDGRALSFQVPIAISACFRPSGGPTSPRRRPRSPSTSSPCRRSWAEAGRPPSRASGRRAPVAGRRQHSGRGHRPRVSRGTLKPGSLGDASATSELTKPPSSRPTQPDRDLVGPCARHRRPHWPQGVTGRTRSGIRLPTCMAGYPEPSSISRRDRATARAGTNQVRCDTVPIDPAGRAVPASLPATADTAKHTRSRSRDAAPIRATGDRSVSARRRLAALPGWCSTACERGTGEVGVRRWSGKRSPAPARRGGPRTCRRTRRRACGTSPASGGRRARRSCRRSRPSPRSADGCPVRPR